MKKVILFFSICAILSLAACSGSASEEATTRTDSAITDLIAVDSCAIDSCAAMPIDSDITDSVK